MSSSNYRDCSRTVSFMVGVVAVFLFIMVAEVYAADCQNPMVFTYIGDCSYEFNSGNTHYFRYTSWTSDKAVLEIDGLMYTLAEGRSLYLSSDETESVRVSDIDFNASVPVVTLSFVDLSVAPDPDDSVTCSDEDGIDDHMLRLMTKGMCTDSVGEHEDVCLDDNRLNDYTCEPLYQDPKHCGFTTYYCKTYGFDRCENGACVNDSDDGVDDVVDENPCDLPGTALDTREECEAAGCDWASPTRGCSDSGLSYCGFDSFAAKDYECSIKAAWAMKWDGEISECIYCDCAWCCCPGGSDSSDDDSDDGSDDVPDSDTDDDVQDDDDVDDGGDVVEEDPCDLPGTALDTREECEAAGCDWASATKGCTDYGLSSCGFDSFSKNDYDCSIKAAWSRVWDGEISECIYCDCAWCCCPGGSDSSDDDSDSDDDGSDDVPDSPKCVDTDNGVNLEIKGSVTDTNTGTFFSEDKCLSDSSILEYSCLNDAWFANYRECKYGCKDGVCLPMNESGCGDGVCSDSESVDSCLKDCAIELYPYDADVDSCRSSKGTVYPATGVGYANWFLWGGCSSEKYYRVNAGEEIILNVITDSCSSCVCTRPDFNISEYIDGEWVVVDHVVYPYQKGMDEVRRYTPESTKIKIYANRCFYLKIYSLSGVDGDGSDSDTDDDVDVPDSDTDDDVPDDDSCSDTDGGNKKHVFGICSDDAGEHSDRCIGDVVVEYMCRPESSGSSVSACRIETFSCRNSGYVGCKDGACVNGKTDDGIENNDMDSGDGDLSCNGCIIGTRCIAQSTRFSYQNAPSYCSAEKTVELQKYEGGLCQNNYECRSNFCSEEICVDINKKVKENSKTIDKILGFLKKLFSI